MIGFFIKKAFFDGWDNVLVLVVFNLGHLLLGVLSFFLPISLGAGPLSVVLIASAGISAMCVWQAMAAYAMNEIADFKAPVLVHSLRRIKEAWKPGLALGLTIAVLLFSVLVGIPFYLSRGGFLGTLLASLLFWLCLVILMAAQYFLPLNASRAGSLRSTAKLSFMMLADNPGFSIFLLFYSAVTLGLSLLLAFILPGIAGIGLAGADAVRLRMKKYLWLESNPGANRKNPPWETLLEEDRELLGKRSLKGMIFPWKDER